MSLHSVQESHLARMLVYMVTVCTNCQEACPMEISDVEKCLSRADTRANRACQLFLEKANAKQGAGS